MAISVLKTNKNTKKYLHLPLCFKICHVLFPLFFNPLPRPLPVFFLNDTVVLEKSSGVSCCTSESFITMSLSETEPDVQTTVFVLGSLPVFQILDPGIELEALTL